MTTDAFDWLWQDARQPAIENEFLDKQPNAIQYSPSYYGLNHADWRPGQREMIEWSYGVMEADGVGEGMAFICEAPTGTGKTTLPRALSAEYKTVSLVRTKVLQKENYEAGYDFIPLYGRSNYPCVHPDASTTAKADECLYAEKGMSNCEYHSSCPYVVARDQAKYAQRAALNYAYWFHAYFKWPAPKVLVCDEGHQLSDQVLEWAGTTISEEVRRKWELPLFPIIRGGTGGLLTDTPAATQAAISWVQRSIEHLLSISESLGEMVDHSEKARKEARQAELLSNKLGATLDALTGTPEDWYIRSGPSAANGRAAFIARPLTARHHFGRYFLNEKWKLFIMSATIGDPAVFASELGLAGKYEYHSVPNMFTAEQRPVLALDVPKMGRGSSDKEKGKQADEIVKAIKECPPDWSGIIHVTAISEAPELAKRLAQRGLEDRVWVSERGIGTDRMMNAWHDRRRKVPGSLNISWAFWEGYDGREEKISIVAKMPFPYLGDDYEVARRSYDTKLYLQRTAWAAEQGLGRSRRGKAEDYDTPEEKRGLVCLADGSYRIIKGYFSESLRQSIVKTV